MSETSELNNPENIKETKINTVFFSPEDIPVVTSKFLDRMIDSSEDFNKISGLDDKLNDLSDELGLSGDDRLVPSEEFALVRIQDNPDDPDSVELAVIDIKDGTRLSSKNYDRWGVELVEISDKLHGGKEAEPKFDDAYEKSLLVDFEEQVFSELDKLTTCDESIAGRVDNALRAFTETIQLLIDRPSDTSILAQAQKVASGVKRALQDEISDVEDSKSRTVNIDFEEPSANISAADVVSRVDKLSDARGIVREDSIINFTGINNINRDIDHLIGVVNNLIEDMRYTRSQQQQWENRERLRILMEREFNSKLIDRVGVRQRIRKLRHEATALVDAI